MNQRLKYARMYCCGPMDFDRSGGKVWRTELTEFCNPLGIISLNPYHKALHSTHGEFALEDDVNADIVKTALENKNYEAVSQRMKFVRATDLRMVDHADFLVARLNFDVIMSGTCEEIATANREKKPVLIWSSVPKNKIPPWYFGMLPHYLFFETLDEVKNYIQHIHSDNDIDTLGRWVFFDHQARINEISHVRV